jgi:hypothetical protein
MRCRKNQCPYSAYYLNQAGGNLPYFYGRQTQRGHGIGSILSSLGRMAFPFLKGIGSYFGRKALGTGVNIGTDLLAGKKFKEAAKDRLGETAEGIFSDVTSRLQTGRGKKRKKKCCKKTKKRIKTILD